MQLQWATANKNLEYWKLFKKKKKTMGRVYLLYNLTEDLKVHVKLLY